MLCVDARLRHSRKLEGLRDFLIWAITLLSDSPVTLRISSKVMRSAQAAQIIQSGLFLGGSGFLTRVIGLLDCFDFILNPYFSRSFKFGQACCTDIIALSGSGIGEGTIEIMLFKKVPNQLVGVGAINI